jgi:hypothetical protein
MGVCILAKAIPIVEKAKAYLPIPTAISISGAGAKTISMAKELIYLPAGKFMMAS